MPGSPHRGEDHFRTRWEAVPFLLFANENLFLEPGDRIAFPSPTREDKLRICIQILMVEFILLGIGLEYAQLECCINLLRSCRPELPRIAPREELHVFLRAAGQSVNLVS